MLDSFTTKFFRFELIPQKTILEESSDTKIESGKITMVSEKSESAKYSVTQMQPLLKYHLNRLRLILKPFIASILYDNIVSRCMTDYATNFNGISENLQENQ